MLIKRRIEKIIITQDDCSFSLPRELSKPKGTMSEFTLYFLKKQFSAKSKSFLHLPVHLTFTTSLAQLEDKTKFSKWK